jgi:hypothetical protein
MYAADAWLCNYNQFDTFSIRNIPIRNLSATTILLDMRGQANSQTIRHFPILLTWLHIPGIFPDNFVYLHSIDAH